MKAIKKIFILANILLFIATIMSYMAPFVNPTKAWIFPFFATSYFWLLISNALFIMFWVALRNKIWLLSFFALLLGIPHLGSYFSLSLDRSETDDLSIMTFNTGGRFSRPPEMTDSTYQQEFKELIQGRKKPSILCLQESAYKKFYTEQLAYDYHQRVGSTTILSDFEIADKGSIKFDDTSNRIVWADLLIDNKTLRIVNMHLQSNGVSNQTEDLVNNPDLGERKTWSDMKSVISKIKHASKTRTLQALEAKNFIKSSPHPTLVVGDFNDTPMSYTYRKLARNYTDAFKAKGNGLGITYAGSIPGLRIDYILGSKEIDFTSYKCPDVKLSDHYPVISRFEF